jgi:hypothetical protein
VAFSTVVIADSHTKNKLVIQVSTDDPRTQRIALNNAVNLQKLYGVDNIQIEIVAYGPGLGLLTKKSGLAQRELWSCNSRDTPTFALKNRAYIRSIPRGARVAGGDQDIATKGANYRD